MRKQWRAENKAKKGVTGRIVYIKSPNMFQEFVSLKVFKKILRNISKVEKFWKKFLNSKNFFKKLREKFLSLEKILEKNQKKYQAQKIVLRIPKNP